MVCLRQLDWVLEKLEAAILSGSVLLMALNSVGNVFGRYLFNQSLYFSEELNQFLVIFITFVGSSFAARHARHISMSACIEHLRGRSAALALLLINLLTAGLILWLTWASIGYVQSAARIGRASSALQLPLHYIYMVIPLGLGLTGLQFLRHASLQLLVLNGCNDASRCNPQAPLPPEA